MKIGFVVECSLEGPEHKLARMLVAVFCPKDEPIVIPMGSKGRLLADAELVVEKLIALGCERVFVIWDWHPLESRWGKARTEAWKPGLCREEVHVLRGKLDARKIAQARVVLTCVAQELEAWALADHNAIAAVVGRRRRRSVEGVRKFAEPELVSDPESTLEDVFREFDTGFTKHNDVPAIFEAARASRFRRMKSCPSFVRLVEKLSGKTFEAAVGG